MYCILTLCNTHPHYPTPIPTPNRLLNRTTRSTPASEPYGQMVIEEAIFLGNFRAGCNIGSLTYDNKPVEMIRQKKDISICKDSGKEIATYKFEIKKYKKVTQQVAKALLMKHKRGNFGGRVVEDACGAFEEMLRMFDLHITPGKTRLTLLTTNLKITDY